MNFLRKALISDSKVPKANHGEQFTNKERDYYELARMLRKLLKDVKRYTALWGELLACKTSIYGYLLYFYNQKSEKRTLIDDLFKFHTRPMDKYVNKLTLEYQHDLIDEIEQILKIFPQTQKLSASLSLKKQQYLAKKQYYQQLKQSGNKNMDYSLLSQVDEERRILQHAYEFSVRRVISEFEEKVNHKDSILDRFCIRMFESDAKLYSNLFKTSRILREKSLIFQYHREYPQGLPSYFRDYSYRQDIQSSSDSDINAPSSNIFYQNDNNININENEDKKQQHITELVNVKSQLQNDELKNNIQPKQPKDLSIDIDEIQKRGKTPPPPAQYTHKKPKAPIKTPKPIQKQNINNLHVAIDKDINNNDNDNDNDIENKTKSIISKNANVNKSNNENKIKTHGVRGRGRVHSKSVSSPDLLNQRIVHRTPPPPPPTRNVNNNIINIIDDKVKKQPFRRRATVDLPMDGIDQNDKSDKSTSASLPSSNTGVAELMLDSEDSLHNYKDNTNMSNNNDDVDQDQDEWQMLSPDALILSNKLPPVPVPNKKKKPISITNNHAEIAQLLKQDNRVQPWVWNKTNRGEEASYGYCEPTDEIDEDNKHPLGVGMHTMLNFAHMHQLFHPKQTRHIGDPNSSVIPSRIHINDIVLRSVNVRKLTLDTNKLDPVIQSMIYSSHKQQSKNIIENIPKPSNTKSGKFIAPQQLQQKITRPPPSPPSPPNGSTPPPPSLPTPSPPAPKNTNDGNAKQHK